MPTGRRDMCLSSGTYRADAGSKTSFGLDVIPALEHLFCQWYTLHNGPVGQEVTTDEMSSQARGRAVGYVRVFEKGGGSYEALATRQIDLISSWAMENDAEVLDCFFDLGVDATAPFQERPAGVRLLDRVRCGDLNFVVVASLDAFGKARVLLDALGLLVAANDEMGIVAVLPSPREEPGFLGVRRAELGPTTLLEPQIGPEALN